MPRWQLTTMTAGAILLCGGVAYLAVKGFAPPPVTYDIQPPVVTQTKWVRQLVTLANGLPLLDSQARAPLTAVQARALLRLLRPSRTAALVTPDQARHIVVALRLVLTAEQRAALAQGAEQTISSPSSPAGVPPGSMTGMPPGPPPGGMAGMPAPPTGGMPPGGNENIPPPAAGARDPHRPHNGGLISAKVFAFLATTAESNR